MRGHAPGALLALLLLLGPATAFEGGPASTLDLPTPTVVHALAVAETPTGFVGSLSTVSITVAPNGTGHVFLDTQPLAQVDMQGSARLAVRVASAVTGLALQDRDYFFVVRSDAPVVGGPSAGGILTAGVIAAMEGWAVNQSVMMTGTITPSGDIGPIGGLLEKIQAARDGGATLFLFPEGMENTTRLSATGLRGAQVYVPAYCQDLGLRCVPVATIEDAVRHVTGHAFERPAAGSGNVTSEGFAQTMQPLAQNLTQQARQLYFEAQAHYDRAVRSIPATVRSQLATQLNEASGSVLNAQTAYDSGRYYTASSRSYVASVSARSVDYAVGLYEAADRDAYMRGLIDDADQRAKAAVASVDQPVRSVAHLEGLGAAQERATEAERAVANARAAYQQGDPGALAWAAQARERSESVRWWLDIAGRAPAGGGPLEEATLNRTAHDLVDIASESIVYAQTLLAESGGLQSDLLSGAGGAQDLLSRAQADVARGFYPAAIFEAIGAEVRSSAALDLAGASQQVVDAKLARARARAADAIVQARADGLEPILAQSYFEYAGDQVEEDNALAFYNTARSAARLGHNFFAPASAPRESRFTGFDSLPGPPPAPSILVAAGGAAVVVAVLVLGLAIGAGVGIMAVLATRGPGRHSPPPAPPPLAAQASEPAKVDPFLEYQEGPPPARAPEPPPRWGEDVRPPR